MTDYEILQQPFNIQTHATRFINYLEVIIKADGTIEYAIPSHSKKLEELAHIKYGKDKFIEMLNDPNAWYDYIKWLCNITKCISVWNDFVVKPDEVTEEQRKSLKLLANTTYTKIPDLKLYQGQL